MPSSGMLHSVALVKTDVSEERSASTIRVPRIGALGTTLAVTSNRHTPRVTRCSIPEDGILHSYRHEDLKSDIKWELLTCRWRQMWKHGGNRQVTRKMNVVMGPRLFQNRKTKVCVRSPPEQN
jgi:hypothetical protein